MKKSIKKIMKLIIEKTNNNIIMRRVSSLNNPLLYKKENSTKPLTIKTGVQADIKALHPRQIYNSRLHELPPIIKAATRRHSLHIIGHSSAHHIPS